MKREEIIELARRGEIRLLVRGGHVESARDGQIHYIGPMRLLDLYGLRGMHFVRFYPSGRHEFFGWRDRPGDIILDPRFDGDYSLESAAARAKVRSTSNSSQG